VERRQGKELMSLESEWPWKQVLPKSSLRTSVAPEAPVQNHWELRARHSDTPHGIPHL
jgi:hypothetical protein